MLAKTKHKPSVRIPLRHRPRPKAAEPRPAIIARHVEDVFVDVDKRKSLLKRRLVWLAAEAAGERVVFVHPVALGVSGSIALVHRIGTATSADQGISTTKVQFNLVIGCLVAVDSVELDAPTAILAIFHCLIVAITGETNRATEDSQKDEGHQAFS